MSMPEYGPLFAGQELQHARILLVTDLGPGNIGSISAADVNAREREQLIADAASSDYHKLPTNRFRCVDGRVLADGLLKLTIRNAHMYADPQMAGGLAISESASGLLVATNQVLPISQQVAGNTDSAHENGAIVVVHGDSHKLAEGCGANLLLRESFGVMADNHDALVETAWPLAQGLGLHNYGVTKADSGVLIANSVVNADNDALWDVSAAERVSIACAHGAEYEELIEEHDERLIIVDLSSRAFSEEQFMQDHSLQNGKSREAFVASLGAYARWKLECAQRNGHNMRDAALGVLGVVLFNVAVPKVLTSPEKGSGEALPVVVLGDDQQ